jgi:hypothetical protein
MAESYLTFKVERVIENSNKQTKIKLDLGETDLDGIMIAFIQFAFLDLHVDEELLYDYFTDGIIEESGITCNNDCECPDCKAEREEKEEKSTDVMQVAIKQKDDVQEFIKQINKSESFALKVFQVYMEHLKSNE